MGFVDDVERSLEGDVLSVNSDPGSVGTGVEVDASAYEGVTVVLACEETGGTYSVDVDGEVHSAPSSGGSFSKVDDLNTLTVSAGSEDANLTHIENFDDYLQVDNVSASGDGTAGDVAIIVLGAPKYTA